MTTTNSSETVEDWKPAVCSICLKVGGYIDMTIYLPKGDYYQKPAKVLWDFECLECHNKI